MIQRVLLRPVVALLLLALAACGGSDGGTDPQPDPAIAVTVSPTSVTVEQGQQTTLTVNLVRSGGYDDPVALTISGLPAGVTAGAGAIPGSASQGSITLTAASGATTGTATATVTATGAGVSSAQTTFTLEVTAAPVGDFALSLDPATLEIQGGASATSTVEVDRSGGFQGVVNLQVTGAPAGLVAQLAESALAGSSTTLEITADAGLTAGSYTLTVTGTGQGTDARTAELTVVVIDGAVGSYTLALDPTQVTVEPGGAEATSTVEIDRSGGYQGPVDLSVTVPTGLSGSVSTASVTGTSTTLTVTADAGLAEGDYEISVEGTGEGTEDPPPAVLQVTVEAGTTPGIGVSLDPASISVDQGASGSVTVEVQRTGGFTGDVDLAVAGAPAGVGATLAATTVSGASTTLDLSVGAGVTPDLYTLTVTGSGTGVAEASATLDLQVTPGTTGGGDDFSWTFCPDAPLWFAVKDGSGPWTQVMGSGSGGATFDFTISSDQAGIAYAQGDPLAGFETEVFFLGVDEIPFFEDNVCTGGGRTVTVTASGLSISEQANVAMGGAGGSLFGAQPSTTLQDVAEGEVDLLGARLALDLQAQTLVVNRLFVARDLDPPNGGSVGMDFAGANSFDPVDATLTLNNLGGAEASTSVLFQTSTSTLSFFQTGEFSASSTRTVKLVPADRQVATDILSVQATTLGSGTQAPQGDVRSVSLFFKGDDDQTLTFGPELGPVMASLEASSPYVRPRVQYTPQAEYDRYAFAGFDQDDRSASLIVTDAFLGSGDVDLTFPDFSGVAGWNDTWGLQSGSNVEWSFGASGWPPGFGLQSPDDAIDGVQVQTAFFFGGTLVP